MSTEKYPWRPLARFDRKMPLILRNEVTEIVTWEESMFNSKLNSERGLVIHGLYEESKTFEDLKELCQGNLAGKLFHDVNRGLFIFGEKMRIRAYFCPEYLAPAIEGFSASVGCDWGGGEGDEGCDFNISDGNSSFVSTGCGNFDEGETFQYSIMVKIPDEYQKIKTRAGAEDSYLILSKASLIIERLPLE